MKITVKRFEFGTNYTVGDLYIDDKRECYTLEDVVRAPGIKVKANTAIPTGTYKIVMDFSPKYQRMMLHILDVPMFQGIRIHAGNTDLDTEGCLLVGETWPGGNFIGSSKKAYDKLYVKIKDVLDKYEDVEITITDAH